MINARIKIKNPFNTPIFISFWSKYWKLSKNKGFEIESYYQSTTLFEIIVDTHFTGRDHAGPSLEICLFGVYLNFSFQDNRHWDYENNCWEKYEE